MSENRELGQIEEAPEALREDVGGKDAIMKLRNVFNASNLSSNGIRLNQKILLDPKLQTHIFDIVTRIRKFEGAVPKDIAKMCRRFWLLPEDQLKMRILWISNPEDPMKKYFLKIIYGVDCAPWQAMEL